MKIFFKILILIFLIIIYTIICANSYTNTVFSNLSNNVFRLHIIANSNSDEDQSAKYLVRDNIINYMNLLCLNVSSKSECIELVYNHLNDFNTIANQILLSQNFSYQATSQIGNYKFPQKNYDNVTLPAGNYDALEIKLGDASGKNWWCILYPSLCFSSGNSSILPEESNKDLENNLDSETYNIISNNQDNSLNLKFKIIELFNNISL